MALEPIELEIQVVVNCPEDAENQSLVLWKGSQCSQPLSISPAPVVNLSSSLAPFLLSVFLLVGVLTGSLTPPLLFCPQVQRSGQKGIREWGGDQCLFSYELSLCTGLFLAFQEIRGVTPDWKKPHLWAAVWLGYHQLHSRGPCGSSGPDWTLCPRYSPAAG